MGCEGGTIPKRKDIVKNTNNTIGGSKKEIMSECLQEQYKTCALSQEPLKHPLALLKSGAICNLPACSHVQLELYASVPKNIQIDANSGFLTCPISGKLLNGQIPFIGLWPCGCIMSFGAWESIKGDDCPVCGHAITRRIKITQQLSSASGKLSLP